MTVPHMGPGVSNVLAKGIHPLLSRSPTVGLRPASELLPDGDKMDPEVSVPSVAAA